MTKNNLGKEGYFSLAFHHQKQSEQEPKQGRNLETGADAKGLVGLLLTDLLPMACSACFLMVPRPTSPDGTTHNGLGPPPSITNEENALKLAVMEAFSQFRLPHSR